MPGLKILIGHAHDEKSPAGAWESLHDAAPGGARRVVEMMRLGDDVPGGIERALGQP